MHILKTQDIEALADRELAPEHAKNIRALVNSSPRSRQKYLDIERQKHLLIYWFQMTHISQ